MIDPTGYDAVVNAAALVYAGRASVTQIKSKKYLAEESACDVRLEFSSEHRNRTSNVMEPSKEAIIVSPALEPC
jgi:hypothetical protein